MSAIGAGLGPFLYCDYWASVLGLNGVVSAAILGEGRLNIGHFRRAVDRPRTRLPGLHYYIFAFILFPVLLPYRVVYDLMRLFRGRAERIRHPVDVVMSRYELSLSATARDRVRVKVNGDVVADEILDPARARCEVSLFYPTYKLLIAGLLSLAFSAWVVPHLSLLVARFEPLAPLASHLSTILYLLLALALVAVLRDLVTAAVAPLPVLAFRQLWGVPESLGGLLLVSAGFVILFFLVEWFLIPRSLPPTLFLYANDPGSRAFPYERGQAPYWLEGRYYWVWRFVTLVPGEVHKFWERDWERVECWVRADGEAPGRLEWVVSDGHYRELWYDGRRLASHATRAAHDRSLRGDRERRHANGPAVPSPPGEKEDRGLDWILEVDMDPIFHSPYVRGVSLVPRGSARAGRAIARLTIARLAAALWGGARRDRYGLVAERLQELEVDGTELFGDVPEHFRYFVQRHIVTMPWSYWRYPMGARSTARQFVYAAAGPGPGQAASDPAYQIKQRRQSDDDGSTKAGVDPVRDGGTNGS